MLTQTSYSPDCPQTVSLPLSFWCLLHGCSQRGSYADNSFLYKSFSLNYKVFISANNSSILYYKANDKKRCYRNSNDFFFHISYLDTDVPEDKALVLIFSLTCQHPSGSYGWHHAWPTFLPQFQNGLGTHL